jgi:hypothetical protein
MDFRRRNKTGTWRWLDVQPSASYPAVMKRMLGVFIAAFALFAVSQLITACAETETIDLKALAKMWR